MQDSPTELEMNEKKELEKNNLKESSEQMEQYYNQFQQNVDNLSGLAQKFAEVKERFLKQLPDILKQFGILSVKNRLKSLGNSLGTGVISRKLGWKLNDEVLIVKLRSAKDIKRRG